jgi:DNA-binding CsgD family transcriptional regulator
LLEYLASEIADSRLLVVGTYRDTEVSRRHRLSDTLGALTRVPHLVRLHLLGLNSDEVRRFVTVATGVVPPASLIRAIHDQTEGNPLFVREVVRFLQQQGHFSGAAPAVTAPHLIRLPEGLREVIGRRLNMLSAGCNDILAVAAVIGRDFALDVLVRVSRDYAEETVLEALDEALSAHLIEETGPGLYQFTHVLVRITLYDELRTGQRRALHHAVGDAIEAVHGRDLGPVLADLARHFHAAGVGGDVARAIDYTIRAGQCADAALAFEDAISLFQNALDMLATLRADDPGQRCRLLLLLGEAQRKANDFPQALGTVREAAALARTYRMPILFAEAAIVYAVAAWRRGVGLLAAQASAMLEEALAGLPETEVGMRIKMTGLLARDRLHSGAVQAAKELALEAVVTARALGDAEVLAISLAGCFDFPWQPHEVQQQLALTTETIESAERAGNLEIAYISYFRRAAVCLELGDIQGVAAAMPELDRLDLRLRQPIITMHSLGLQATLALMRGALDEAERIVLRSIKARPSTDTHGDDPVSMLIFSLRREQGRLREFAPLVTSFVRQNTPATTWRPGLALLYLELGEAAAARVVFDDLAADEFAALPQDGRWTSCLIYLAEVCAALGDAARAQVLYRLLLPWAALNIVAGGGTVCWGSAGRFLGLLATVMGHWLAAERHFTEALAMNEQIGAVVPLAHTHHDYAAMLMARGYPGDRDTAAEQLRQAAERADAFGLAALASRVAERLQHLPNPKPRPAAPDELTTRELEVLRLLAIGRRNADIAMVLSISLNTVATHVRNILAKTGCANRTEAAAYAMQNRLQGAD